ncbi:IS66 family transposase [Halomonas daqiaonensis]|uniref:IS66 family transposase n=1 Tax=Halomonas daqiaonensis TaxID=650850 RepID=UPI003CC7A02A
MAQVVTHKFINGLPLYRQEAIFARQGIELLRQTMSSWLLALVDPLAPLMAEFRRELLSGPVVQIDETPIQVLREPTWWPRSSPTCRSTGAVHPASRLSGSSMPSGPLTTFCFLTNRLQMKQRVRRASTCNPTATPPTTYWPDKCAPARSSTTSKPSWMQGQESVARATSTREGSIQRSRAATPISHPDCRWLLIQIDALHHCPFPSMRAA